MEQVKAKPTTLAEAKARALEIMSDANIKQSRVVYLQNMPIRNEKGREVENWLVKTTRKTQFYRLKEGDPNGRTSYEVYLESIGIDVENDYHFLLMNDPDNMYEVEEIEEAKEAAPIKKGK